MCLMARAVFLQLSVEPNVWPSLNWQDIQYCTRTIRVSYPRKGARRKVRDLCMIGSTLFTQSSDSCMIASKLFLRIVRIPA